MSCAHRNITWPRGPAGAMRVVCLNCATALHYDWEHMKIGGPYGINAERVSEAQQHPEAETAAARWRLPRVPGLRSAVSLFRLLRAVVGLVFGAAEKRPGRATSRTSGGGLGVFRICAPARPGDSHRSGPYWTQHHTPWPRSEGPRFGGGAALRGPSSIAEELASRRDQNVLGETSDS